MGLVLMSERELKRLEVLNKVIEGRMTVKNAILKPRKLRKRCSPRLRPTDPNGRLEPILLKNAESAKFDFCQQLFLK